MKFRFGILFYCFVGGYQALFGIRNIVKIRSRLTKQAVFENNYAQSIENDIRYVDNFVDSTLYNSLKSKLNGIVNGTLSRKHDYSNEQVCSCLF